MIQSAPRPRSPRQSTAGATRRFAWAPVASAVGYQVELFNGAKLIFRERTKKPQILVPGTWRFNGRRHALRPGAYRWYVWPLVAGRRKPTAIVQARLVVPR